MNEQVIFSKLLHNSGHGIALRQATQEIDIGDICYWDTEGKACRILNIFENTKWLEENKWPKLELTKEHTTVDASSTTDIHIVHGGQCWWGVAPVNSTTPPCFDIYFQSLSTDTAVVLPSSPITVTGLRATTALQKWWSQAKRHAFRTWPHLINSPTGIFLVTKTVKTKHYAHCLSKGHPGQISQIRVHGTVTVRQGGSQFVLPAANTQWVPIRNDLEFEQEDSGGKGTYTIFIEREACRMFALTDASLKDVAVNTCCMQPTTTTLPPAGSSIGSSQNPGLPSWAQALPPIQDPYSLSSSDYWIETGWSAAPISDIGSQRRASLGPLTSTSSLPSWSTFLSSGGSGLPSPTTPAGWGKQTSDISPKFDGRDRLSLGEGWFLIRGENTFFLELSNRGLDMPIEALTLQTLLRVLTRHVIKPITWIASSHPPPAISLTHSHSTGAHDLIPTIWNSGLTNSSIPPYQSVLSNPSLTSTPISIPTVPEVVETPPTPSVPPASRSSISSTDSQATLTSTVTPPEKTMPFEIPWGWL